MKFHTNQASISKDYELSSTVDTYFNDNLMDLFRYKIDYLIKVYYSNHVDNLFQVFKHSDYSLFNFLLKVKQINLILHVLEHLSHVHRTLIIRFDDHRYLKEFISNNADTDENFEQFVRPLLEGLAKLEKIPELEEFAENLSKNAIQLLKLSLA